MKINILAFALLLSLASCNSLSRSKVSRKDLKKDVELVTSAGSIIIRLYDDTPISRNNFLSLVKEGMYDSILFHRVIEKFMIQAGEAADKDSFKNKRLHLGFPESIPAEINSTHFHKRGVLGAAREGDDTNPERKASFIQFYIVQGKTYTANALDSAEVRINKMLAYNAIINDPANKNSFMEYQKLSRERDSSDEEQIKKLKSNLDSLAEIKRDIMTPYTFSQSQREAYKTVGGAAHLDQNYTVFGEVITGMHLVDKIAATKTSERDRPVEDILILSAKLIKRVD